MRRVSRWCTHWLHPSHSHWLPPPRQLGEVAVGQEGHHRQSAASCPLSLQEALSALEELHQKSKHLHLRPLNLQPHSVVSDSKKWHNWGFLPLSLNTKSCFSPCCVMLVDAQGCGLVLWTGTIFFITTGLPCPASSGPAPPEAMRITGLGATGG